MAITKQAQTARLQLRVETGTTADGRPVLRTRTFSRVKSTATDAALHNIAAALTGLQEFPLYAVRRVDEAELVDDGI